MSDHLKSVVWSHLSALRRPDLAIKQNKNLRDALICVMMYRYKPEQRERERCWDAELTQSLELSGIQWLVGGKQVSAGRTRFVLEDSQSEPPVSHYLLVACVAVYFCFKSTLRLITVSAVAGRCFKCGFSSTFPLSCLNILLTIWSYTL